MMIQKPIHRLFVRLLLFATTLLWLGGATTLCASGVLPSENSTTQKLSPPSSHKNASGKSTPKKYLPLNPQVTYLPETSEMNPSGPSSSDKNARGKSTTQVKHLPARFKPFALAAMAVVGAGGYAYHQWQQWGKVEKEAPVAKGKQKKENSRFLIGGFLLFLGLLGAMFFYNRKKK